MKLNTFERMTLIPLLPTEESYAGMGDISKTKMSLQLTAEEAQQLIIPGSPNQQLDPAKSIGHIKDIPISEWMTKTIRKVLVDLDNKKSLKENQLTLFAKFVLDYEQK